MKKLLVIGTLLLSASAFSAGKMNGMMQGGSMGGGMMQGMSCPMMQQDGMMKGDMMQMMTPEMKKAMQKQMIAIEEKQLELHKALAEDKVDWDKVGKLNRDLADMKADMETGMMKMHSEMMEKMAQKNQPEPEKKQ